MADYLANPGIEKKNSLILDELTGNYLPELQKNNQLYVDFKVAIGKLLEDCYNMTAETQKLVLKGEAFVIEESVHHEFIDEAEMLKNLEIAIHEEGIKMKIKTLEAKYHRANIETQEFDKVPYLKLVQVDQLPNKMIRLDQTAQFQDALQDMPEELANMRNGSELDQAYFLLWHGL